jgi:hypothetical protein
MKKPPGGGFVSVIKSSTERNQKRIRATNTLVVQSILRTSGALRTPYLQVFGNLLYPCLATPQQQFSS